MKVDDRSAIAEHFISQLWEKKYFTGISMKTTGGKPVTIVALGKRNYDAGPDFKGITIKIEDQIYTGDLEIHRAVEDWYRHKHHADPAYNNVIMHLVIGSHGDKEPAIRLNREPVLAEVFVDIADDQFPVLAKQYGLAFPVYTTTTTCPLSEKNSDDILAVIDYFSRERLQAKAERFREQHQLSSWNQVLYLGIMEALGYSKNQAPFRRLANLLPFEALMREYHKFPPQSAPFQLQGLLLGAAGLLPSQDPSFDWKKIEDQDTQEFVPKLENAWQEFHDRLGLAPMQKSEWLFFRLRPTNFPTRRLAGVSLMLKQFMTQGILEKILRIVDGLKNNPQQLIKELENCFVCKTEGYWATHYRLEEKPPELSQNKTVTLIGGERAREIVVNIVLPVLLAYANEIEDAQLKINIMQLYQSYPKSPTNSIIKMMNNMVFRKNAQDRKAITTAARQQGLIHLYKLYCRRSECDRCRSEWEKL